MELGKFNELKALRESQYGMYLADAENEEVLLPNKYAKDVKEGDTVSAFIYKDSEDRLVATTQEPKIKLHEIAPLEVVSSLGMGAFLDWGLDKDLFVAAREQKERMKPGEIKLVYLYIDEKTDRLAASSRLDRFLSNETLTVKEKEKVDVLIWEPTDLGMNVVINQQHKGLIYYSDLFRKVKEGDYFKGYIQQIRPDNKIDVTLQPPGYKKVEPNAEKILEKLEAAGGFLPFHDKSDPYDIKREFEMSKKTFKKAIGALFKERIITIEKNGIKLKK